MKAEIIAVGTELLIGQIVNTNARYISRKLNEYGISVYYHSVVGDNRERIKEVFDTALSRSDLIVFTGGLGPTEDDLTKETVCEHLGIELVLCDDIRLTIERYFAKRDIRMAKSNIKQAYIPLGSAVLYNEKGTAPGFYIVHEDKKIVILPGPPIEMEPMFSDFLERYVKKDATIFSKYINIFGIGESAVEEKILDLLQADGDITIATYASIGQVVIRLTVMAEDEDDARRKIKDVGDEICRRFGNDIFSDEETDLPAIVMRLLREKKIKVAVAESCTGGLISKLLTDQPGASEVFLGSIVAYDNKVKERSLRISAEILDEYGAVSEEVCGTMAEAVADIYEADIGVSATGIAGPGGGTEEKPVGTVYIGISDGKKKKVRKFNFNGDRNKIRNVAAMSALDMLRRELI